MADICMLCCEYPDRNSEYMLTVKEIANSDLRHKMDSKNCEGHCPKCGSTEIDWGTFWITGSPMQNCVCNACGCEFVESYEYKETIITN